MMTRLANKYEITIATVARSVKPNWTGNSGTPPLADELGGTNSIVTMCGLKWATSNVT